MNAFPGAMAAPTIQADQRIDWIPFLLLLTALLQGTSVTLTLAVRVIGGSAVSMVTVIWLVSYTLALFTLLTRNGIEWINWMSRYRLPLLILTVSVLASTAWSIAPGLSLERGVHLAGSTLLAIAIGFTIPLTRILHISTIVFAILMAANIVTALAVPDIGIENYEGSLVWRGVMASKNTLGFWAAIAVLLFTTRLADAKRTQTRLLLLACIGMALLNLVESASATSLLAMLVSAMIMVYLYCTRALSLGFVATTCLGLMVIALSALAFRYINTAELIGRSGDLTGRGELWSQVWHVITQKPVLGFGYGTIWYPTEDSLWIQETLLDMTWTTYHAHNGLLQLASELGLPLTLLTVAFALMQLVEIVYSHQRTQPDGALFVLGFCIALLVSNYSEARLIVNRELYWIFFIALPISLMRQIVLVPVAPPRSALLKRLNPSVRSGMVKRRQNAHRRNSMKRRLLPRLADEDSAGAGAGVVDAVANLEYNAAHTQNTTIDWPEDQSDSTTDSSTDTDATPTRKS